MSGCPECGYENLEFTPSGQVEALFDCVYDEVRQPLSDGRWTFDPSATIGRRNG